MAKGAPAPAPTQTTTTINPERDKLVDLAMPYATKFAKSGGPDLPDFSLVAGFDPLQSQGQEMVLGNTGAQQDIVSAAGEGNQFLSSGAALDPNSNPALQATIDASVRPVYQNLMEQILPKIRSGAVVSGNYGGSRQGIAEGLAIRGAGQTAADTAAKVATAGYNSGLDAMGKAQGQAGNVASAQSLPGMTTSGVGDVRQALAQALLGEKGQRFSYDENMPLMMAKELMALASGVPGGTTVATGSTPQQPSTGMQVAGMAMQALPLMFALSDPEAKENVLKIGELIDGTPIFVFNYKGDIYKTLHMGLMADQVAPESVVVKNGLRHVDYKKALAKAIDLAKENA